MLNGNLTGCQYDAMQGLIEASLRDIAADAELRGGRVGEAMATCLLAPGKRIRPLVTLLTAEALDAPLEAAMAPACALEMIHTASLILDDLPCMDDAGLRRGLPTCHVAFGEDIAVLAAFALLNDAQKAVAIAPGLTASARNDLVRLTADAVGFGGLIAGQEKDLHGDLNDHDRAHGEKTGALFVAAARAGAMVAGVSAAQIQAAGDYGANLGLAFQTYDDFVDTYGDQQSAGKDVGKDTTRSNVVSMVGRDRAIKRLMLHVQRAVAALEPCGPGAEQLGLLAHSLMDSAQSLSRGVDLPAAASAG